MSSTNGAKGAAWAILVGMGGTTMTFNIYHATHAGHMRLGLALLYGVAPVCAAAGLSHIVAVHKGGWFMQGVTFAVMLGAMALSIGATASVVGGTAGPALKWVFGGVLDAAALIALRVILSPAPAVREGGPQAGPGPVRTEVPGPVRTAVLDAVPGPVPGPVLEARPGGRSAKPRTAGPQRPRTAPKAGSADDLALEAKALNLLATNLEMTGAELARRLGVTDSYGRKLRRRLTGQPAPSE